jgi:NAD(P)-dependent dehydrogenase (short-subunit alcohol dehydrogenase family)
MSERPFDNQFGVVTGSTRGWGRAVAIELARLGAAVVINGRTEELVESTVAEITQAGGRAAGAPLSVASLANAREIVRTAVTTFGRLDFIVNSAGIKAMSPLLETTEEHWDEVVDTELKGVFTCTKAAAEQMVEQGSGGRIVNMGGSSGFAGSKNDSHHAAAKAGVINATSSWAQELQPYGITVNAVRAGIRSLYTVNAARILREMLAERDLPVPESDRDLGFFEPAEAAPLVTWLLSPAAAHVTGWFLGIDGPRISIWEPVLPQRNVYRHPGWTQDTLTEHVGPLLARPKGWLVPYANLNSAPVQQMLATATAGRRPRE